MPFLHPRFVAAVCAAARDADAAVPHLGGFRQPLAAAYRTALAPLVGELVADGPDEARVSVRALRDALAATTCRIPRACATSTRARTTTPRSPSPSRPSTSAASVRCAGRPPRCARRRSGAAAAAVGVALDAHVLAALNGDQIARDPLEPLAEGDEVAFMAADAGG